MSKILINKPGYVIICERCSRILPTDLPADESSDSDFFWCEHCTDYRSGKLSKLHEIVVG